MVKVHIVDRLDISTSSKDWIIGKSSTINLIHKRLRFKVRTTCCIEAICHRKDFSYIVFSIRSDRPKQVKKFIYRHTTDYERSIILDDLIELHAENLKTYIQSNT